MYRSFREGLCLSDREKECIERGETIEKKKCLERKYICLKIASILSESRDVVIKGSFLFSLQFAEYGRVPSDLDFILNATFTDAYKMKRVDEIIMTVDRNIMMRKKVSCLRYGYYSYISSVDDQIETIKIECLTKAPLEKHIELNTFEGYPIRVLQYTKQFVDKLMSLCYFNSSYFSGPTIRMINCIYDIDFILKTENYRFLKMEDIKEMIVFKLSQDKIIHMELCGRELDVEFIKNEFFKFDDLLMSEAKDYIVSRYNSEFSASEFIGKFERIRAYILKLLRKENDRVVEHSHVSRLDVLI